MRSTIFVLALALCATPARADYVADWMRFERQLEDQMTDMPGGPRNRGELDYAETRVALAMFEALNAIDRRYASVVGLSRAERGASPRAAAAAAVCAVLKKHFPGKEAVIDDSAALALALVKDKDARDKGIRIGEAAAVAAMTRGGNDPAIAPIPYRPRTLPGVWSATALPVLEPYILTKRLWALPKADAVRPDPPPALSSKEWARDFEEVRHLGAKTGSTRTADQTVIARFSVRPDLAPTLDWIADQPGRTPLRNARMYTRFAMARDDAMVAVTDAKLHYDFWRPISAIRNADQDDNPATERDAGWVPLLNTPNHPEYPCGHCIIASVQATVLADEGRLPPDGVRFRTLAETAIVETVPTYDAFVDTVSMSRIYAGVHYRFSNDAAIEMGRKIGTMALAKLMLPVR